MFRLLKAGCVNQLSDTINIRWLATMSELFNKIPDVDIDDSGKFKYILLNVHDKTNDASKTIVRGYKRAEWHGE
ncbi:hypothetical protein KPH14_010639 [Odynerus spinipes]|uniref:Uncharacterized protein n=1 Tax=Odynerus spinipes TaxID=1348599 RepID=A0AAD9RUS7_9HYME|nr:hypothetical protein KPH14_010639 [Odynerus spinipes]